MTSNGEASQSDAGSPADVSSQLAAPSEGSRMTRNIMPATTGGSMNGEISSERSSPGIRFARNSSSASQVPPTSCIASDAA